MRFSEHSRTPPLLTGAQPRHPSDCVINATESRSVIIGWLAREREEWHRTGGGSGGSDERPEAGSKQQEIMREDTCNTILVATVRRDSTSLARHPVGSRTRREERKG